MKRSKGGKWVVVSNIHFWLTTAWAPPSLSFIIIVARFPLTSSGLTISRCKISCFYDLPGANKIMEKKNATNKRRKQYVQKIRQEDRAITTVKPELSRGTRLVIISSCGQKRTANIYIISWNFESDSTHTL